ncbi:MAG TPA: multidrug effflux MFS transporter [Puia sp.]|nr:multidrug effflux MFS transporter [Puia sp.]
MAILKNKRPRSVLLILMIGALNTITPISIDMYLPAFPKIARDLNTTVNNIALSVSTYFLGFALGQILYGPLLDRFGRKRPLYVGLLLYIMATIACGMANSVQFLWLIRFVQALSGCVAAVAAMAMVLDFFPADKSAGIISLLILILGISPLLAPSVGSLIVTIFNWRFVFFALAAIAFVVLLVIFFFLPEGHTADRSVSLMPKRILTTFRRILFTHQFFIYAMAGTFSFAGLFVYVAGSPAIFMGEFQTNPKRYGLIFACLSIGFIGSSQLNHLLTRKFRNQEILKMTLTIQLIATLFFVADIITGWYSMASTILFLFVILSCTGLTYPNAASLAIAPFAKNAGSASALLGFIQIGVGGLISAGVGAMPVRGTLSTSSIMAVSSLAAFLILILGSKLRSRSNLPERNIDLPKT